MGADGALTILDQQTLMRWTPSGGLKTLKTDARFGLGQPFFGSSIAVDGQGRVYFANVETDTVSQYAPTSDLFKIIAGPGGLFANGATVDDSLDDPGFPTLDAEGNLYISDTGHGQVKVIKAGTY